VLEGACRIVGSLDARQNSRVFAGLGVPRVETHKDTYPNRRKGFRTTRTSSYPGSNLATKLALHLAGISDRGSKGTTGHL